MNKKNNSALAIYSLVKRNIKFYLKDKMMVFFSVLAPIIVLAIYILFLGDMQVGLIQTELSSPEYADISLTTAQIRAVINSWMVSGVMGVSCITVGINACSIMVRDRERGFLNDFLASPIKKWQIYLSYVLACFIISVVICFAVLLLAIVYLLCSGSLMMSITDFLGILGTTIISTLSSSLFIVLIASFIKTVSALGSFSGVFSAIIGFLVGAYLPLGMMPEPVRYISCFVPGTYSASLFRYFFISGPMRVLGGKFPADKVEKLLSMYSVDMNFFGMKVSPTVMILVLVGSIVLFGGLLLLLYSNKKTNFFMTGKRKKK